jgi:PIN domain nuclease of toxin-antitoxin system
MVVVDASAVLALMLGETGSDVVLNIINDAEMTAVNLSECMQRAIDLASPSTQPISAGMNSTSALIFA